MISVIIIARNERLLSNTIRDIFQKFTGKFEVIVVLDGASEYPISLDKYYPNLYVINKDVSEGVRPAINDAIYSSSGDFILKTDAHCSFCKDFDTIMESNCDSNWVSVASRYTLNIQDWTFEPRRVDYFYLSCPWNNPDHFMMQSCPWISKSSNCDIDDLMSFQGSMWFMSRKHWEWLGCLNMGGEKYAEHHEISMKTWLGGGRVVINKNGTYAHPKESVRGYHMSMSQVYADHDHSARFWTENKWNRRVHDFDWLVDKFWPLPTADNHHRLEKYVWPEDWRKYYDRAL